ncbi:YqaJ viral recombinase family protein [Corynebacterium glyciniphilum]|uniref:YqaJ viral recombinase family protein n=1 Tax=Corynebacterium glyciniphilum TaxID=1404244 RepID=UPI0011AB5B27|nr:YqaJ viral recombinase family protein [Corynebacterium glyciniphilum]
MTTPTSEFIACPPKPGTREHDSYISASKVPAIMGVDPHGRTIHDIYDHLIDPMDAPEPDEFSGKLYRWGHAAEPALVEYWAGETGHSDGYFEVQPCYRNPHIEEHGFPHIVTPDSVFRPRAPRPHDPESRVFSDDPRACHIIEAKTGPRQGLLVPARVGPGIPIGDAAQVLTQMGIIGSPLGWIVRAPATRDDVPEISQAPWSDTAWELIVTTCAHLWDIVQQTRTTPNDEYDAGVELDDLAERVNGKLAEILLQEGA